jgi:hypothetical protein
MRQDLQHEKRQNEALRHLAQAVEAVAAHVGMRGVHQLAEHVEAILKADDTEPSKELSAAEILGAPLGTGTVGDHVLALGSTSDPDDLP